MEVSLVRKRLRDSIEHAHKAAAARRAAIQESTQTWEPLLERLVTPLVQQVSKVLKSEGYGFRVSTPAGSSAAPTSAKFAKSPALSGVSLASR